MRRILLFASALAVLCFSSGRAEEARPLYTLQAAPRPLRVKKGEKATALLAVVPRSDAHVSPEAPVSLAVSASGPLEVPRAQLGRAEAKETSAKGVEFAIPVVGRSVGTGELQANLVFFICTDKLCERRKERLAIAVQVE